MADCARASLQGSDRPASDRTTIHVVTRRLGRIGIHEEASTGRREAWIGTLYPWVGSARFAGPWFSG